MATWDELDTGWAPIAQIGGMTPGLSTDVKSGGLGTAGISINTGVAHLDHPFFWFAALAAVTFGLIGGSTHLRVGPFKAGASAGKD